MSTLTEHEAAALKTGTDPAYFVREVLGDTITDYQVAIMESVRDNRETAVAACHGPGKSYIAGRIALWFTQAFSPCIAITTAPTDRQVRGILWKEIRQSHSGSKVPLGGQVLTQEINWGDNWWCRGFTAPARDPDRFQGFHERDVLVIVDEAAGVSQDIYDGIAGILSSEHSRLLMIGNPTDGTGRFGRTHAKLLAQGSGAISISAFDTPNFQAFGITLEDVVSGKWKVKQGRTPLPFPKLVAPQWAAWAAQTWGVDSPLFKVKVLGEFVDQADDSLINLQWVVSAQNAEMQPEPGDKSVLAVDVARFGQDSTVIMHRKGPWVRDVHVGSKQDTMMTAGHIVRAFKNTDATTAIIDGVGVGAGVVDRIKELGYGVSEFSAGSKPEDTERFINRRGEEYWNLRERFEAGEIDINPDDDELVAQLTSLKWKLDSRGRIVVERKEDAKRRGLPSPDKADALMQAFARTEETDDGPGIELL